MHHHYPYPTELITASTPADIKDQVESNVVFDAKGAPHLNFQTILDLLMKFGPAIFQIIQAILGGLTPPPTPAPTK